MKNFFYIFAILFIAGCSDKEILKGKRHLIFENKNGVINSNEKISLGRAENYIKWYDNAPNNSNLLGRIDFNFENKVLWTFNAKFSSSDALNSGSMIIFGINNDKICVSDINGVVYCLNKFNGNIIWKTCTSPNKKLDTIGTYLSYADGKVFVTTSFAELIILNASNGKVLRKISFPSPAKAPVKYKEGLLFVLQSNNSFSVLDAKSFKVLWTHNALPEDTGFLGLASVAIKDNIVIVPYKDGELFAFDINTSGIVWNNTVASLSVTATIESIAHIKASPVIYKGSVYVLNNNSKVMRFDINTGDVIWESDIAGSIYTPYISGNAMYFISNANEIIALNNNNGEKFWEYNLTQEKKKNSMIDVIWYSPILTTLGLIVINSDGDLLVLSSYNGKLIKRGNIPSGACASPIIAGKIMYLMTNNSIVAIK